MFEIKNDYDMIVWKLPETMPHVNLYAVADPHFGSQEFNRGKWDGWKDMVKKDENSRILLLGDMMDNALKNSKTDIYKATMSPMEQKRMFAEEIDDIGVDKVICALDGNHEGRTTREVGTSPIYDVMAKLDLEDLYRENIAFIKINVGMKRSDRQFSYGIVAHHGGSKNKVKNFIPHIDGMDVFLSGHIHDASSQFPAKIIMDMQNEVVRLAPIIPIVVPSFADYGGYAMRGLFTPTSNVHVPVVQLAGTGKKGVSVHWI